MTCYRLLGRIGLRPALSAAEHEYLLAFAESRRWRRAGGPYAVPGNPAAECLSGQPDPERWSTPAEGQPGLYCPWRPADDGGALVPHTGADAVTRVPPEEVAEWLAYLFAHFLGPDPVARSSRHFADCLPPDSGTLESGGSGESARIESERREPGPADGSASEGKVFGGLEGSALDGRVLEGVAVVASERGELGVLRAYGDRVSLQPLTAWPAPDRVAGP